MQELQNFLTHQRLYTLATCAENSPWVANVYGGFDSENHVLYFVSSVETKHSKEILKNSTVACNTAWFNTKDHTDRKAVQMVGRCVMATSDSDIQKAIQLHNRLYPEFVERLTVAYIQDDSNPSTVWKFTPNYIKFWNDELYGEEAKEFIF